MTLVAPAASDPALLTGGAALVRLLRAAGVRDVFGVPAGKFSGFLKAVGEEPGLRHLGVRHEASAAGMAAGIFEVTGRLAVAYGESGPGSHNLVPASAAPGPTASPCSSSPPRRPPTCPTRCAAP